ncbi:MAG: hydrogenase [Candidatus Electrothrix sp. AW5]|nr:hydrogenase [Candidatus Electrothrix gigas]MCI5196827.1 hydrogenase [Candidatus Electrothrix gigas]MCI5227840.1 hydrogenase [Candidatus Electrothrix gigas]
MDSVFSFCFALLIAPLFPAVIQKVKAWFGGRQGPPLLINYYTLFKLVQKGSVYSTSTSFIFKIGPMISAAAALLLLLFFPFAGAEPLFSFQGDVIVLFYLIGLGRFFTILAALDTASPFEGMGTAREAFFSSLTEPTIFTILFLFFKVSGSLSFAGFFSGPTPVALVGEFGAVILLAAVALYTVMLTENSRVPVDDPATHLELTMIHEVMILDHSGPDLAMIEAGAWSKLLFYCSFIASIIWFPRFDNFLLNTILFYVVVTLIYVSIGVVESITARYRMNLVPKFILNSFALMFFVIILTIEFAQ